MPTYFDPSNGMPVEVPRGMESDFIAMGYRSEPPKIIEYTSYSDVYEEDEEEESTPEASIISPVSINQATLKEMCERLGLTTPQARIIRDNRPYDGVEDLIALMPEITWLVLDSILDYDREQDSKE